jgi:hypothetical protein
MPPATRHTCDTDLTACGTRQELTEGQHIGVSSFVEPSTALDEFGAEIAQMGYGPTEARYPETEKTQSTSTRAILAAAYGRGLVPMHVHGNTQHARCPS